MPARLRTLRAKRKVSQFAVAAGSGVSLNFYHRLEHGTENPSVKTLQSLATYFGIPLSDLVA